MTFADLPDATRQEIMKLMAAGYYDGQRGNGQEQINAEDNHIEG